MLMILYNADTVTFTLFFSENNNIDIFKDEKSPICPLSY